MSEQPQSPPEKGSLYPIILGSIWIQFLFRTNFGSRYLDPWFRRPTTHIYFVALAYVFDPSIVDFMPLLGPFSIVVSIRLIWEVSRLWFSKPNPNKHSYHMGRPLGVVSKLLPFSNEFIFTYIEPLPTAILGGLCLHFSWDIYFGFLMLLISLGHLVHWLQYAEKEDAEVLDIRDQLLDSKRRQGKIEEAQGLDENDSTHYAE